MPSVNAYLMFDGQAKDAMTFYQEIFGGEATIMTVGDTPMADQMPQDKLDQVMHARLQIENTVLMASDNMGEPGSVERGNGMQLAIGCDTEEQLKEYFTKLSDGANVIAEPRTEFWGDTFGQLVDKFGVQWMLNHATAPSE